MPATPFDHPLLSALLGDDEIARHFTVAAELAATNRFEAALALAEAAEGVIPAAAADVIAATCATFAPDTDALRDAFARDGVIGPDYVRQLRAHVGAAHGDQVHFGATSQDAVDTSLILRLSEVVADLDERLQRLGARLDDTAARFGGHRIMARTRMQEAFPIAAADRIAAWRAPLQRHRERLLELKPRLLVVQFGGAVGTRDRLGDNGDAVAVRLAAALNLVPAAPWHNQRDNLAEFAGWLSLVSGGLGKVGADVATMALAGEITLTGAGTSSAIPGKANPVRAEILVALARHNAALLSAMHQALVHEQERSGAAWTGEWLALPQMVVATGAALNGALALVAQIETLGRA